MSQPVTYQALSTTLASLASSFKASDSSMADLYKAATPSYFDTLKRARVDTSASVTSTYTGTFTPPAHQNLSHVRRLGGKPLELACLRKDVMRDQEIRIHAFLVDSNAHHSIDTFTFKVETYPGDLWIRFSNVIVRIGNSACPQMIDISFRWSAEHVGEIDPTVWEIAEQAVHQAMNRTLGSMSASMSHADAVKTATDVMFQSIADYINRYNEGWERVKRDADLPDYPSMMKVSQHVVTKEQEVKPKPIAKGQGDW
jgi:hypothetical protein